MSANTATRDNLMRLLNLGRGRRVRVNRGYSVAVRGLRLVLPLVALAIVAVVFAWPNMDDPIAPIPREDIIPQESGRNELINPRFESMNAKMQPYIITAARAEQAMSNQKIIMMESPVANITLDEQTMVEGEGQHGTYDQQDETLVLKGDVKIRHSNGYVLESPYLHVDLRADLATTPEPVQISGPAAQAQGTGLRADHAAGIIILTGPARLVLTRQD